MKKNQTIIISCAGMGTRLGIGTTKALVDIDGKPLIIRQLEMLEDYEDIRIIVGYQADKIIEVVKEYRKDVMFAFNNDYMTTGTGASLSKGLLNAREYVVALDGDLLVKPSDLEMILNFNGECIGGCITTTDNPVLMSTNGDKVVSFSREKGEYEWTGLAKIKTNRLVPGEGHVYQMIEPLLPIELKIINTKEIDTMNDYEKALKWFKNNYMEDDEVDG